MTDRLESTSRAIAFFLGLVALLGLIVDAAKADPFIEPGRSEVRIDLQTLADDNIIRSPLTAWPLSWQSVRSDLEAANESEMSSAARAAFDRLESELELATLTHRVLPHFRIGGATEPVVVRSFTSTPREKGEIEAGMSYTGDHLSFKLNLMRAFDSPDDWRVDGSYFGFTTRNWSFTAGYPERWWGPGMQGSLILSTNARPIPQVSVQRLSADGFGQRWLRWIGPWSVTTFIGQLDDERTVKDALLFGLRLTARPLPQLELAFSRTAQLCGNDRPCGTKQFFNMLVGKDNRGRNVAADEEPGNQLAGLDGRWSFTNRPLAIYWQWIGEDSRQGGPQIGSWLRMVGFEIAGSAEAARWQHRTFLELADTTCQQGGIGFGGNKFDCAYQHGTFRTGYRYRGRPIGYPTDGDSETASVITVLNGPNNQTYEFGAYSSRLSQGPVSNRPHSLSRTPASRIGIDIGYIRKLPVGRIRLRLSVAEQRDQLTGVTDNDSGVAIEWMVGY